MHNCLLLAITSYLLATYLNARNPLFRKYIRLDHFDDKRTNSLRGYERRIDSYSHAMSFRDGACAVATIHIIQNGRLQPRITLLVRGPEVELN